jgi:hypothetical protein
VSDFIGLDVQGIDNLVEKLENLPPEARDAAVDEVAPYLLNVFKLYPPYTYVKFKDAYGNWFSDKQRKYVMARIREGTIRPGISNRTQSLAQGWKIIGEGGNSLIVNEVTYAVYVMGVGEQARMPKKIGWKTIGAIVRDRMDQIVRRAEAGVSKALRKLGL